MMRSRADLRGRRRRPSRTVLVGELPGHERDALEVRPYAAGQPPEADELAWLQCQNARLRGAGFPLELTAPAYAALDAYIYGFMHTEFNRRFQAVSERAPSRAVCVS
jgi:hypothetical protein